MTEKEVVLSSADKARHAFDAENNVEPCRAIAERIVRNYPHPDNMVDDISHAIEDARALGEKRKAAEIERLRAAIAHVCQRSQRACEILNEFDNTRAALEPKL